ncbi:peptidylprolyl isomerase [Chloroflexota bacterium]
MAKKKKAVKLPRELTRHQLAGWQRQKKRQRIIFIAGVCVITAVLVIIGVGWYAGLYRPQHQTAIMVNDTKFNMKYYVDMLKLRGEGQSPEFIQLLTDDIVRSIEQNELIRQEALKLGISASNDEIKERLKKFELPVNNVTRDLAGSQILLEKLQDDYFNSQVPVSAEQAHIMAMLLESESQASDVRTRLESGEDFAELAGELSMNLPTKTSEGDLGWHPESILTDLLGSPVSAEYAFGAEAGALSQPLYDEEITKGVGYWLVKVLSREEQDAAQVQAILLGSEEKVQEVQARLAASDNFTALAMEFSQLTGADRNGGELSVTAGRMTTAFDEFVYNLDIELETLSEPIRDEEVATKGGYWLVKVLDKEDNKQIEESDRDSLKAKALDEWVSSLWDNPANDIDDSFLTAERKDWAISQVSGG